MTDEKFNHLVKRLEGEASRRPGLYKLRVFLLALLGYGYVLAVLGVVLLLVGLGIYLMAETRFNTAIAKLEIFLLVIAGLIVRALWVRLSAPEGLALERGEAPTLFAEVDRLRETLRTPRIHRVLLTPDFNASMAQVPRLGVFGWHRNYLSVGLPLMQVLSPAGFRSVLAHELGHLSRAHSRFGGWIYRVRRTWERLLEEFEQRQHRAQVVFKKFFEWYAPYFGACSFVLARRQEYEADRHAADASGSRAAAEALVAVSVAGEYLEREFWPSVFRRVTSQPAPVQSFHEMESAFAAGGWKTDASGALERALKEETDVQDTHPCLRDRLAALGEEPALPEPPTPTAAQHYLGPSLAGLTERLQSSWTEAVAPGWRERYEEAQREKERLAELEEKRRTGALDADEAFERASLTESLENEEAALPLYREALELHPEHADASFALGRLLLEREDPEGVRWIEAAIEHDSEYALAGSSLLAAFWRSRGDGERARAYTQRIEQEVEVFTEAQRERAHLQVEDRLIEHGLAAEAVSALAGQLARYPEVKAAWLTRKEVRHRPDLPVYVLGIKLGVHFRTQGFHQRYCQRLASELSFPGESFIVSLDVVPRRMARALKKVPGAEIYGR
jgi:Zn-dependent protease with chaperone function/Tfp pilus assembly protein PilF